MKRALIMPVCALAAAGACLAGAARYWRDRTPASARAKSNPYAGDPEAAAAGAKLYRRHCAACHGKDAQGLGRAPGLRTPNVERSTPGELHWLLTNGILSRGMPSWSQLPGEQRWQIVAYLKSEALRAPGVRSNK